VTAALVCTGSYASLDDALRKRSWFASASARQLLLGLVGIALFFAAWWAVVLAGLVDARFIPSPLSVASTSVDLIREGAILRDVRTTLWRTLLGFGIGAGAGLVVGFGMAMSRYVRLCVYPIFVATFPLPKIALVPLSLVYLGSGNAPIVAVVAVSAFYLLPVNIMAAVDNLDTIHRDVARDLHVSRNLHWRTISLPHALPMILAALRSAWAISLVVVVGAEMLIGEAGLGYVIWHSSEVLSIEPVFTAFVLIGLLGYGSHLLFDWLTRTLAPWQPAP
jgi:ABC-type nitrate/sulfonate/bicarbonate transport system permease component